VRRLYFRFSGRIPGWDVPQWRNINCLGRIVEMHLHWIKPLIGVPGPFATVYIDATRGTETGYREVVNRWQALRRSLKQQGAPESLLELIDERITAPTHEHGPAGRVVIAANSEIYVDRYLRTPPQRDDATYAPAPALLAAARASEDSVNYLIAAVDRLGVDIYAPRPDQDRKSTRLNSSHVSISYAVFC